MTPPPLPLTLPDGAPLPPRPTEAWRQHTGTTLAKHHPEAHALALDLLRTGEDLAEVARAVAEHLGRTGEGSADGLRKIVRGWAIDAGIDRSEIRRRKAGWVAEEGLDTATKLLDKATPRDLGSVAMTFTQAHQMERNLGGLPTEIKVTTKLTLADLHALSQPPPPRDITPIIDIDTTPTTP
jgi:hypothetical protein